MLKRTPRRFHWLLRPDGESVATIRVTWPQCTASSRAAHADARSEVAVPEWMTEEWKHRVEAEARGRLKRDVSGVGTRR